MDTIRPAAPADLAAIAAIQAASPQAARWEPAAYLDYDVWVAVSGGQVLGFLAARTVGQSEHEILNLAVAPEFRRRGVARALLETLVAGRSGAFFLEVRESNPGARGFYQALGFQEVARRPNYYQAPLEAAIVMKFHSC